QEPSRRWRPGVHPGPRLTRHLRPRVPGKSADRRPTRRLPPRAQPSRRRAAVVPASAADARLLGIPHGVNGSRAAQRDLPGSLQPLSARPRPQRHVRQHVWAFLGDGEMDEPESRGAAHVAALEGLDNLTFVINCNLQRLDGPVRGNGKIIQELESFFRGAGWNVIKVIWGREWDALLHADRDGALVNLMNTTPDGDYQTYKANDGAYVREHF